MGAHNRTQYEKAGLRKKFPSCLAKNRGGIDRCQFPTISCPCCFSHLSFSWNLFSFISKFAMVKRYVSMDVLCKFWSWSLVCWIFRGVFWNSYKSFVVEIWRKIHVLGLWDDEILCTSGTNITISDFTSNRTNKLKSDHNLVSHMMLE